MLSVWFCTLSLLIYVQSQKKKPSGASKAWIPEETWPGDHQNGGSRELAPLRLDHMTNTKCTSGVDL